MVIDEQKNKIREIPILAKSKEHTNVFGAQLYGCTK